jgi:chromosome segregation ATPase
MADNLRLRVVLDFVDRALGPLKRVSEGSRDAARALKAAKESLKALNAQQAQVGEFRTLKGELHDTAAKLAQARGRVGELARMYGQTAEPTRAMTRELEKAKREAAALGNQHDTQQMKLQQLRTKLSAAGISTRDLANHSQRLRTDIAAANSTIDQQTAKLKANGEQQRKLAELRKRHGSEMMHTGMIAAGSAALMAGGNKMAGPLRSVVGAFMPAEVSETQLRASMMGKAGCPAPPPNSST